MVGHDDGLAGTLTGADAAPLRVSAPVWDRFAHWPRLRARAALAVLLAMLLLAAWAPGMPDPAKEQDASGPPVTELQGKSASAPAPSAEEAKDNDLIFYRLVTERVRRGEDYYVSAVELQRANNYPVKPGLTVRLPTLAVVSATLGTNGTVLLGLLLVAAALLANLRRFQDEPGGEPYKLVGTALVFVGLATAIHPRYMVLHEVWASVLLALSFGLHRPAQGRWLGAWLAAAAALAVRELALPYVLLMAAFALWHRRWREGAAWAALALLFGAALAVHLQLAEAQLRPGDPASPPWLVFGGLQGWLYKIINSSGLSALPAPLAGPLVILAVFGWSGWRSAAGSFATLLLLGYGLAFMIAGRDNNFYWGLMVTPILFPGLALAPFAARALWRAARPETSHG